MLSLSKHESEASEAGSEGDKRSADRGDVVDTTSHEGGTTHPARSPRPRIARRKLVLWGVTWSGGR
jgi:hypothetical protein